MEIGLPFSLKESPTAAAFRLSTCCCSAVAGSSPSFPFRSSEPSVKLGGLLNNLRIQGGGKFSQNLLGRACSDAVGNARYAVTHQPTVFFVEALVSDGAGADADDARTDQDRGDIQLVVISVATGGTTMGGGRWSALPRSRRDCSPYRAGIQLRRCA